MSEVTRLYPTQDSSYQKSTVEVELLCLKIHCEHRYGLCFDETLVCIGYN